MVVGCDNSECVMWHITCHVSGVTDLSADLLGIVDLRVFRNKRVTLVGWEAVE